MAANDGPVPVRTLAHAARLIREARQLGQYGIAVSEPVLDYPRLLARVREVVNDVACPFVLARADRFAGCVRLRARRRCAFRRSAHDRNRDRAAASGGKDSSFARAESAGGSTVPGFEFTNTHSDAWSLTSVPPSMLVIGGGATGAQVASVFNAFGSRVQLFHRGPRILPTEDEDISAAVASAFRSAESLCRRTSARSNRSRKRRRRAHELPPGRRPGQRGSIARGRGRRLAGEHGRAEPRGGGRRDRSSGLCQGRSHICERPRRTSLPRAMSPVACCWSRRRFRTASWRRPTRFAARR